MLDHVFGNLVWHDSRFVSLTLWRTPFHCFNTLRPRQNGRHFPDDIFKWICMNETVWILINISLKFVPRGPINNIPTLIQVMAWRRPGDKSLSEPMMVRLPTHICVTRPQWVEYVSTYILVPHKTIILIFIYLIFMSHIVLYFLT